MARPEKDIDWKLVEKKMEAGCTATEIAGGFHMHIETFSNRFEKQYGCYFTEYKAKFHSHDGGKGNIKFRQYAKAMEGNTQMLIHLGKHWLGQKDNDTDNVITPEIVEKFTLLMNLMKSAQDTSSERNIADNNNNNEQ